jgi:hypothetical protein
MHAPLSSLVVCLVLPLLAVQSVMAGPFGDTGIPATSPQLRMWADSLHGYAPTLGAESNATVEHALGVADGMTVSLGDMSQGELLFGVAPGSVTVQFDHPFRNGPGWDLAVFENAFTLGADGYVFGELAYVEVSTDGNVFARFPATSLTESRLDVGFGTAFSGIHPTDVHNLAGKHGSGTGTSFDLADLRGLEVITSGQVDLDSIAFVRLVDIAGSPSFDEPLLNVSGEIAFPDQFGNPILDPWNTIATGTAGFDLDAVGARYARKSLLAYEILDGALVNPVPEPHFSVSGVLWFMLLVARRFRVRK